MFQFVVPSESVNYCLNPSAESSANFTTTGTATVTRSTSFSRQVTSEEMYSFRVQTSAGTSGLSLTTASLPSSTTYVSCWIRGSFANLQFKINATTVTPTAYETDGAWTWYVTEATAFTGGQVSGQTAVLIIMDSGSDAYVDHVVVQQGSWTTAFHGSFPGCRWEGVAHESTSTLLAVTLDGQPNLSAGVINNMDDTTTAVVSSILGLGLPDVDQVTVDTADRGRMFQSASLNSRTIGLSTALIGSSLSTLQTKRASILDLVQPGDPFVLRYRGMPTYRGGTADVWQIAVVYAKGMEGTFDGWVERVNLTLTAYDPLLVPQTETATTLSTSTSIATMGYALQRKRGVWQQPGTPAPPGVIYDVVSSSKGHVFAAGTAGVYGWDGSTWGTAVALTGGGTVSAFCLAFDPAETVLYVGGNFGTVGATTVNNIAAYTLPGTGITGGTIAAMAGGFNNSVRDIVTVPTTSGHDVYAFGQFTTTGGTTVNYQARYRSSAWGTLIPSGLQLNGTVYAAEKDAANNIYLAGNFTNAATITASAPKPTITKVANGGSITGADGVKNFRYKIAGAYAGETAAGSASSNVQYAATDGGLVVWTSMADVYGYFVYREVSGTGTWYYLAFTTGLSYYDDGSVDTDTTRTAPASNGSGGKRVAYYNTKTDTISAVTGRLVDSGAGTNAGLVGDVYTLALAPDSTTLYAGGAITAADSNTANAVAVWTGGAWLAMGDGVTGGNVRKMLSLPSGAIATAGAFTSVGNTVKLGTASPYLAYWLPGEGGAGIWVNGDLVLPSSTVYALASDANGDLWLGSDSNGAATVGTLTSVTGAGMGGGLLGYPRIYVKGPGLLRYIENQTTGHRIYLNMWAASGELVILDLRRGYKVVQNTRGETKLYYFLGGDLGRFGLRSGTNRIVTLMTSTDGNSLVRLADPGLGLSVDG